MMSGPIHTPTSHVPLLPLSRNEAVERILGHLRGKTVLVIGIGGGGDVVSTLPTCFDLERLGATVIPGGLTWKRLVHDHYGRPRPLSRFRNVEQVNDLIGEAGPTTTPDDSPPHSEAGVSSALAGRPVAMLDISRGSSALQLALADYKQRRAIDAFIGVDAGGDVLCCGDEPTLESPICDQTLLATLSGFEGSLLGVFGYGSDGELPPHALRKRFKSLTELGAFRGGVPIFESDISLMQRVLELAPTEASRLPVTLAASLPKERLSSLSTQLDASAPNLDAALEHQASVPMRDGFRTATLSDLSAATMYFDPRVVFSSSQFGTLWDGSLGIDEIAALLAGQGITTEFTEKQRLSIRPHSG